jgi:hypothetical protein
LAFLICPFFTGKSLRFHETDYNENQISKLVKARPPLLMVVEFFYDGGQYFRHQNQFYRSMNNIFQFTSKQINNIIAYLLWICDGKSTLFKTGIISKSFLRLNISSILFALEYFVQHQQSIAHLHKPQ